MKTFRADMHVHSHFSDGSLSPEDLLKLAAQKGLSGLSITDHDTIGAYPAAFEVAKSVGVELVSGVEFSSHLDGINVHILGYNFPVKEGAISALCQRHTERRRNRNRAIIERLQALNIPINEEDLKGHQVGRPHIAEILCKRRVVRDMKEAFNKYLGEGRGAYVQGEVISVKETLEAIHADGGKAFLAHPHLLPKRKLLIKKLLAHPFDGIECYYARFPKDQEARWLDLARERNLLISGGSDFHGSYKPHDRLGSSWIDASCYDRAFRS